MIDTTLDYDINPIEWNSFDKDPWSVQFKDTATEILINWEATKPIKVTPYNYDTQDLYNHLIGRLREDTLALVVEYMYDSCRAFWDLLHNYINL